MWPKAWALLNQHLRLGQVQLQPRWLQLRKRTAKRWLDWGWPLCARVCLLATLLFYSRVTKRLTCEMRDYSHTNTLIREDSIVSLYLSSAHIGFVLFYLSVQSIVRRKWTFNVCGCALALNRLLLRRACSLSRAHRQGLHIKLMGIILARNELNWMQIPKLKLDNQSKRAD